MEITKSIIILCCAYYGFASHEGHIIPVENYETELHNLGEHVDVPETPVRVIKITKTVAVKVPVPYPVKVIQKVPYPVHISKPYPVPVPHIVKVPHVESPKTLTPHEAFGSRDGPSHQYNSQAGDYQVDEQHSQDGPSDGESYQPIHSYSEGHSREAHQFTPYGDDYGSEGGPASSYGSPSHNFYGGIGRNDVETIESKNYDNAIKNYLQNINSVGNERH